MKSALASRWMPFLPAQWARLSKLSLLLVPHRVAGVEMQVSDVGHEEISSSGIEVSAEVI